MNIGKEGWEINLTKLIAIDRNKCMVTVLIRRKSKSMEYTMCKDKILIWNTHLPMTPNV